MILLTGATGTIGKALLPRLLERGLPVRCLVRDPRRLGPYRVQVSISIGDVGDRFVFGTALRGVDTVVHLAAATRDQRRGSIEELCALATKRLVNSATRQGVKRIVFISPLAASAHSPARFFRAAALAERAVRESTLEATIFKVSMVYAADDRYLGTMAAWSRVLPVLPLFGGRDTEFEPLWAVDAAEAMARVIAREQSVGSGEHELMGPEVLTNQQILHIATRDLGRRRPLVSVPYRLARLGFDLAERKFGPMALATPDEIDLLTVSERSRRGVADIEALGIEPASMNDALRA